MNFTPTTNCLGVDHDNNYRMVSCCDGHITFSYASKGKAMTIHFASDKIGLRYVRESIDSFCKWLFKNYDIKMIFGAIDKNRESIMKMIEKIEFVYLADDSKHHIFVRNK